LSSTNIATILLDRELRIKRYTPATTRLFNLIAADVGRPLGDISREFEDDDLQKDADAVLDRLAPVEKEVRTRKMTNGTSGASCPTGHRITASMGWSHLRRRQRAQARRGALSSHRGGGADGRNGGERSR
jgi:hypothetical protein